MNRVNVNYKDKQTVSDIFTLTNVVTRERVALIPSDSNGNFSWTGITKAPIVRNAMQTSNTSGEWSDLEYPYMAIPQEDWTGGRGNLRFSTDKSRFFDSRRAQTAFNACIYNAPLDHYSTGFKRAYTNCPQSLTWVSLQGTSKILCRKITGIEPGWQCGNVYIHLRKRGVPQSGLQVRLLSSMGDSQTVYASHTYTIDEVTDTTAEFMKFSFDAVTCPAELYLEVGTESWDINNYWEVGCVNKNEHMTYHSSNREKWEIYSKDLLYRLDTVQSNVRCKYFMYEQLMFMVRQAEPNGTPSLWMNGDIGKASAATATTITDSTKSWTADAYAGARIGLVYRNGIEGQVSVWRKIISNTSTTLTVNEAWDIIPSAGCIFIIVDTPIWKEITGHGLTAAVTDIHVIKGVVYFAQGDYVAVRKMRWSNGAFEWKTLTGINASFMASVRDRNGMMLYRGRNDGIKHFRCIERSRLLDWDIDRTLKVFEEPEDDEEVSPITPDTGKVFGQSVDFENPDIDAKQYVIDLTFTNEKNLGSVVVTLQESEDNAAFADVQAVTAVDTGRYYIFAHCRYRYRRLSVTVTGQNCELTALTCTTSEIPHFEDPTFLIDNYGKITKLFEYGAEQEKSLWIFQEGMVSSINKTENSVDTYNLDRINLDELQVTADEWNGSAVGTSDVYLMWAWLNGLQRHYNTQLEGKGPDHDEGMPENMQGRITQIVAYPGSFFVSIDGGDTGYSSIMMYNGSGWHNLYRAPNKGERIFDIAFQPIYGDRPDRLWSQVGDNVIWLSMPSKILYALQDPNAEYTHESVVVSSWITGGMAEVDKLWQSLSIMADYLDGKTCWIEADYQLDDEKEWHPIQSRYIKSPQQEENFAGEEESVNGKKLRWRLRLQTSDLKKTPKVNVVLVKAVGRVDIKYSYGFHFRNIKYAPDLTGEYEELEPYELDEILSRWANELVTLRLNSAYKIFDDKRVFLDGVTTNVVYEKNEGYLSQITLTEI